MSSESVIKVVYESLGQGSQSIVRAVHNMDDVLDRVEKAAEALFNGDFEGEAGKAYLAKKQQWRDAAGKIAQTMLRVASAVDGTVASTQEVDSAAAKLFAL